MVRISSDDCPTIVGRLDKYIEIMEERIEIMNSMKLVVYAFCAITTVGIGIYGLHVYTMYKKSVQNQFKI